MMDTVGQEQDKTKEIKEIINQEIVHKDGEKTTGEKTTKVIKEIFEEVTERTFIYQEIVIGNVDKNDVKTKTDDGENSKKNKDEEDLKNINKDGDSKYKSEESEEMRKVINQGRTKENEKNDGNFLENLESVKEMRTNVEKEIINNEIVNENGERNIEKHINEDENIVIESNDEKKIEKPSKEVCDDDDNEDMIGEMRRIINQEMPDGEEKRKMLDLTWEIIEVAVRNTGDTAKVFNDPVYENERRIKKKGDKKVKVKNTVNKEAAIEIMKKIINQGIDERLERGKILIEIDNLSQDRKETAQVSRENGEVYKEAINKKVEQGVDKDIVKDKEEDNIIDINKQDNDVEQEIDKTFDRDKGKEENITNISEKEDIIKESDKIEEIRFIINQGSAKQSKEKGKIMIDLKEFTKERSETAVQNEEEKEKTEEEIMNKNVEIEIVKENKSEVSETKETNNEFFLNAKGEMKEWIPEEKADNDEIKEENKEIVNNDEESKHDETKTVDEIVLNNKENEMIILTLRPADESEKKQKDDNNDLIEISEDIENVKIEKKEDEEEEKESGIILNVKEKETDKNEINEGKIEKKISEDFENVKMKKKEDEEEEENSDIILNLKEEKIAKRNINESKKEKKINEDCENVNIKKKEDEEEKNESDIILNVKKKETDKNRLNESEKVEKTNEDFVNEKIKKEDDKEEQDPDKILIVKDKETDKNEIDEMLKIINQKINEQEITITKTKTENVNNQSEDKVDDEVVNPLLDNFKEDNSKANTSHVAMRSIKTEKNLFKDKVGLNLETNNEYEFNYVNDKVREDERFAQNELKPESTDSFVTYDIFDTSGDDVLKVLMDAEKGEATKSAVKPISDDVMQCDPSTSTTNDMILSRKKDSELSENEVEKNLRKKAFEFKYVNEENLTKTEMSIEQKPKFNDIDVFESSNNLETRANAKDPSGLKSSGATNLNIIVSVATVHAEPPNSFRHQELKWSLLSSGIKSDVPRVKMGIKKSKSFDERFLKSYQDSIIKTYQIDEKLFGNKENNKKYLHSFDFNSKRKPRRSISFDASFLVLKSSEMLEITEEYKTKSNIKDKIKIDFDCKEMNEISQGANVRKLSSLKYEGEDIFKVLASGCEASYNDTATKNIWGFKKFNNDVPIPPLRKKRSPSVPALHTFDEKDITYDDVKLLLSNSEIKVIPPPRRKLIERKKRFLAQQQKAQNPLMKRDACKSYSLSDINALNSEDIDFLYNDRSENRLMTSADDSVLNSQDNDSYSSSTDAFYTSEALHLSSVLASRSPNTSHDVCFASPETTNFATDTPRNLYDEGLRASVALLEDRLPTDEPKVEKFVSKKTPGMRKKSYTFTKGDTYLNEIRDNVKLKKKSSSVSSLIRRTFSLKEVSKSDKDNPPCLPNLFKKYRQRKKRDQCDLKNLPTIPEEHMLHRSSTSESFKSIFIGDGDEEEEEEETYAERCIGCYDRKMSFVSLRFPDQPEPLLRRSNSSIDVSQYASSSNIKESESPKLGSASCLSKGPLHRCLKDIVHENSSASLNAQTLKRAKDLLNKTLKMKSNEEPSLTKISDPQSFENAPYLSKGPLPRYLLKGFGHRNRSTSLDVRMLKREENLLDKTVDSKSNEGTSISKTCESSTLDEVSSLPKGPLPTYEKRSASLGGEKTLNRLNELLDKSLDTKPNDPPAPPKRSKSKQSLISDSTTINENSETVHKDLQAKRPSLINPKHLLKVMHKKYYSVESFKSIFSSFNDAEKVEKKPKETLLSSIFNDKDKKKVTGKVTPESLNVLAHEHDVSQKTRLAYLKREARSLEHISQKIHDLHDSEEEYHDKVMRTFIRRYSHDIEALNDSKGKLKELTNMYQVNVEKNEEELEKIASKEILGIDKIADVNVTKLKLLDANKRRESLGLILALPSLNDINNDNDEQEEVFYPESHGTRQERISDNKKWNVYKFPCKTAPDFVNKETLIKECLDGTFRLKLQNYVKSFKAKVDTNSPEDDYTEKLAGQYEREILKHLKKNLKKDYQSDGDNDNDNYDDDDDNNSDNDDDLEDIRQFAKKYELDLMALFEIKGKNFLKLADTEIARRRRFSGLPFINVNNSDVQEHILARRIDDNEFTMTEHQRTLARSKSLCNGNALDYSHGGDMFMENYIEMPKHLESKLKKKVSIAEPEIITTEYDYFSPYEEEGDESDSTDDEDDDDVNKSCQSEKEQMDFDENLHPPAYHSFGTYETNNLKSSSVQEKIDSLQQKSKDEQLAKVSDHESQRITQSLKNDSINFDGNKRQIEPDSTNIEALSKEYEVEILAQVENIIPQVESRLKNISKFSYLNMKTNEHGLIENTRMLKPLKLAKRHSEYFSSAILPKYPLIKRASLDSSLHPNGFKTSTGRIPEWFKFQPLSLAKLASNIYFQDRKLDMFAKMMDTSEAVNKFIHANSLNDKRNDGSRSLSLENSEIRGFQRPLSPVKHRRLRPSLQHLYVAKRDSTIMYESGRPDSPIPTDVEPDSDKQFPESVVLSRSPLISKKHTFHFPYEKEDFIASMDIVDSSLNADELIPDLSKSRQSSYEEKIERSPNKIVPNPLTNRKFIISPVTDEGPFSFEDIPEAEETEETRDNQFSYSNSPSDFSIQNISLHREISNFRPIHRTDAFDSDSLHSLDPIRESPDRELNTVEETANRSTTFNDSELDRTSSPNDCLLREEEQVQDMLSSAINEPEIIYHELSDSSESLPSIEDDPTIRHLGDIKNTIKDQCALNCQCHFHSDESDPIKILALHEKSESPEYVLRTWYQRQETTEELKNPSPVNIPKWVKEDKPSEFAFKHKDTPSPGPPSENSAKLASPSSIESENNSGKEEDRTQKDRCVEIYPETIRQRQRNMAPSPSKVDIKNWEPSSESNEDEKKFLPSVKALRNQFENGKSKSGSSTLVRTSSDSSNNSLVLNSLDTSSGFGSLTSSQVTLEHSSSGIVCSSKEKEDEPVEPIFSQFREVDAELKEMMSKPPSTQGFNPHSLLKRLYYVPDAPKMHRREAPFVNIEGYLEKLPSGRKKATFWNAWKRRYFVAKDGILYYYQNNQAEKANMKLPLMGGKIEIMDPSMISVEDGGREPRNAGMLGIDDGKGHYVVVRCPSRQEAERWKQALETHTVDDFSSHYVQPWPRPTNPTLLRDTLVIDIGSCSVRAGVLASQPTLPQLFFPSVVATNRETKSQVWGMEALMPDVRTASVITFPVRPSHKISKFSVDLNAVSSLLQKTFNDLKVDPKNYNIQLSVPRVLNPHTQAELLKILFDKFGVKSVNMTHQSILALYAYNATSGIIVDIGERLDVVPVIDGYIVDGGVSRVPYGGYRIMDHLRQFLFQKNISLLNESDSYIIRQILENICYCAQHYNTEKQRCTMNPENFEKIAPLAEFFTEDSQFDALRNLSLDFGRFQATEGLFNPDAWGLDHPGLHKLVHKAIQECSMDIRKELSRSIFLVGGVTQLPGIVDRLTVELDNLTPPAIRPKVHASPYRYHASYLGACILAESDAFAQSKITKEEWTKQGNSALRKWAL